MLVLSVPCWAGARILDRIAQLNCLGFEVEPMFGTKCRKRNEKGNPFWVASRGRVTYVVISSGGPTETKQTIRKKREEGTHTISKGINKKSTIAHLPPQSRMGRLSMTLQLPRSACVAHVMPSENTDCAQIISVNLGAPVSLACKKQKSTRTALRPP